MNYNGGQSLFGLGFLFLVPLAIGLVLGVVIQWLWPRTGGVGVASWAAGAFFILSIFTGSGFICVIMAFPIWLPMLLLGGVLSNWVIRRPLITQAAAILALTILASGAWLQDSRGEYPEQRFTVERSVVIAAPPEGVWPHLLRLNDLSLAEGQRTMAHDWLGVPRPLEAIVKGEGVGAVRTGRWARGVWFEEHITLWESDRRLNWRFVFPEGSTFTSVDQHIDPRGPNVIVERGGYRIEPLANGFLRLRLHTTYAARTAVNGYASLWGARILGDVQSNILSIIKARAEANALVARNSGDAV
jgi:Polyketide cyclase / dehydrase and lipid transport